MAQIKLVLSDMDGTLVPFGASRVSRRTLDAVRGLQRAGIAFGPSSGRELSNIVSFFWGDERCIVSGIMGNGKLVYVDGELVYRRPIPRDLLEAVANDVRTARGVVLNMYPPLDERGRGTMDFMCVGASDEELAHFRGVEGEPFAAGAYDALPKGDVTSASLLVARPMADVEEVRAAFARRYPGLDFVVSGPFVIDILEHGWTKASALPILEEALGVRRDEIAYFGDSANDLAMMEAVPNSFCMGNGTPDAKAAARWTIGTCDADGAAQVMEVLATSGGKRYFANHAQTNL